MVEHLLNKFKTPGSIPSNTDTNARMNTMNEMTLRTFVKLKRQLLDSRS